MDISDSGATRTGFPHDSVSSVPDDFDSWMREELTELFEGRNTVEPTSPTAR